MGRPHQVQGHWKTLNENLAPLRRYLESQVGRPWNKIYSDICRNLDRRNAVMDHVFLHIEDYVAINVQIDRRGRLVAQGGHRSFTRVLREDWHQELFVDPCSGILRRSRSLPQWRSAQKRRVAGPKDREPDPIVLDEWRELHRIDGIWYEVTFAPFPQPRRRLDENGVETWENQSVFDLLQRRWITDGDRYAVAKSQISKAQLKTFGISNLVGR